MFPDNKYSTLIETKLKNFDLGNIKLFKYSSNPQILTGEIEVLTNYSERKRKLEFRKKMFEDKEDEQSLRELDRLDQLYTLGGVSFDLSLLSTLEIILRVF